MCYLGKKMYSPMVEHIYVDTCMHAYIYTYIYIYLYTYIHRYAHMHIHVYQVLVAQSNETLQWPDTFAEDEEGNLWLTTNKVHEYKTVINVYTYL